jgi:hypothetical protein
MLIKAQGELKDAEKTGMNPHFGHGYSTLQDIFEVIKPVLQTNGLGFMQSPEAGSDEKVRSLKVTTRIFHTSGEWVESDISVDLSQAGPQALGSAITYLRRYSITALLGVASEEDDDGNKATPKPVEKKPPYVAKAATPTATPKPATPASAPTAATPKVYDAKAVDEIAERAKKFKALGEEIIRGFRARGMLQKQAFEWCEKMGWDIALIRHEMGLDVDEVPLIPRNGEEQETTEDIPF